MPFIELTTPSSLLTNQESTSLIGSGNPSCLSIIGALIGSLLNGGGGREMGGQWLQWFHLKDFCALPTFPRLSLQPTLLTCSSFKPCLVIVNVPEGCVGVSGAKEGHVEFQSALQVLSRGLPRQQQPETALGEEPDGSAEPQPLQTEVLEPFTMRD